MTLLAFLQFACTVNAQMAGRMHFDEHDGLSHRHITQILQDKDGFIWLSTWNGLNRFDGREFVVFKSRPGDGAAIPSNSIGKIAIDDRNPEIINCRIKDKWFHFSTRNGTFTPASDVENKFYASHPGHGAGTVVVGGSGWSFSLNDRQGLHWNAYEGGIDLDVSNLGRITVENWKPAAETKSIAVVDGRQVWVASRNDKTVRILEGGRTRYLASDGRISATPVAFGSPVYCICEDGRGNGDIWFGSKPDGAFRLRRIGNRFDVVHMAMPGKDVAGNNICDIKTDRRGRVWMASMGSGLICLDNGCYKTIRFGRENYVKRVCVDPDGLIVAATTEGLLIVECPPGRPFRWRLHQREPDRAASLSDNSCMDIITVGGHWFVATETGGINEVIGSSLTDKRLSFSHYDEESGLGSDVIMSLTPYKLANGRTGLLAVSNCSLIILDPATGESREFSDFSFQRKLSFSEARPLHYKGTWLFGLDNGIAIIDEKTFADDRSEFPIVLTSISIENRKPDYTVNQLNAITLEPNERTLTVAFAVLDFRNPKNIRYAYRINGDSHWHYTGNNNRVLLSELSPGDYKLELMATNAMGKWNAGVRTLNIVVKPKFVETVWFRLIILLTVVGFVVVVLLTRRYIKRIKAKQKKALEDYLALLEKMKTPATPVENTADDKLPTKLAPEDDAFMSRVVAFVKEHMADSDANVDDMAAAAAVSRTSLNRKMKSITGVTPADFIREARIKHACMLLTTTKASISDIAYRCGFTSPRYFSNIFRQTTGMSPSEYRKE